MRDERVEREKRPIRSWPRFSLMLKRRLTFLRAFMVRGRAHPALQGVAAVSRLDDVEAVKNGTPQKYSP